MTSDVKQALSQVLMPKAGIEGKAARNRVSQPGFDAALGLATIQQKSGGARAHPQQAEAPPSWQRLAAKLGTAIDRMQGIDRNLAGTLPKPGSGFDPEFISEAGPGLGPRRDPELGAETGQAAVRSADAFEPPEDEMRQTMTVEQASEAPPPLFTYPRMAAISATPVEARNPQVQAAAGDQAEVAVARDAPADPRAGSPRSSVEGVAAKDTDGSVAALPAARSGPVASAVTEPGAKPRFAAAAPQTGAASVPGKEKDANTEAAPEAAKPAPRITVLAQQNIPAPMPSTAIVLVESITAGDLLEPARTVHSLDAIHASAAPASGQSLKIQLHPAELGMVTATLRFAGQQLSIELQVENHEAHRRLTSDSDTIVSTLRDLGYDIDRVTVLQPAIASSSTNRSDAGASMASAQGRAPDQPGSGATGGGNGGASGRQPENSENPGKSGLHYLAGSKEKQASGLYI